MSDRRRLVHQADDEGGTRSCRTATEGVGRASQDHSRDHTHAYAQDQD
jgi:hypothetical protein